MFEDISAIDKMIKELKQDKWETEAKHDTDEVHNLIFNIKHYKQLQKEFEQELFTNNPKV